MNTEKTNISFKDKARKWLKEVGIVIKDWFINFGKNFVKNIKKFGQNIAFEFRRCHRQFVDGSIGTKLSYFILGSGNLLHKQFVKGFIFLALQVLFILYMVLCPEIQGPTNSMVPMGYKSLVNLQLLGVEKQGIDPETFRPLPDSCSFMMLLFGLFTIILILGYLCLWVANIRSSFASDIKVKAGKKPTTFIEDLKILLDSKFHVLMLTPTCIAALLFTVLPTIFMICLSFTTYNLNEMELNDTVLFHWNGFTNFSNIFNQDISSSLGKEISNRFFPVLGWTLIWAVFATFTCYFGGIFLALLINKKGLKFKKVYRTFFVLTIAIPQFVSLLAMRNIFASSGPVNSALQQWGWIEQSIPWLGGEASGNNPHLAKFMIILINMWLGIPYTMLMTSGILMNIPTDLYEAARVDGTSRPKMFFKITLPYIIFVTTPYLIGSFIGNINSFNTIYLLTGGGPKVGEFVAGETDLLVTWLFKLTIDEGQYNTGAVIGIFTFIITATITLVTYRRSKAYKEEDTFQ